MEILRIGIMLLTLIFIVYGTIGLKISSEKQEGAFFNKKTSYLALALTIPLLIVSILLYFI